MEDQVDSLNQKIAKTYQHMKSQAFYLHAICVHEGDAYSGHYYAFIYDRASQKWRKFNDIRVTDVTEEEVFK